MEGRLRKGMALALLLLCSPLGAGDWPCFRHDRSGSGQTADSLSLPLSLAWRWKVEGMILSSPAVAGGVVYVGTEERSPGVATGAGVGSLCALEAKTGRLLWRLQEVEGKRLEAIHCSPAVEGEAVYFVTRGGVVYRVSRKGKVLWRYPAGGISFSSPAVAGGVVFVGTGYPNKHMLALDAKTGRLKWRFQARQPIYSSPVVGKGMVYFGADDGHFYAVEAATGRERWRFSTRGGIYASSPALAGGLVICVPGDYDQRISALEAESGKLAWQAESGSTRNIVSSPAGGGGRVYLVSGAPQQNLYALNAKTGAILWKAPIGVCYEQSYASSPAICPGLVLVGAGPSALGKPLEGALLALDASTGQKRWEFRTRAPILSSPAVSGGMVFVGCNDGTLYAFSSRRR